ncbi:MAG: PilZ domain-containing protein [Myxococcales bacterium]|nr:PilZ domain-containing protein [Myxococcales bacterium]
MQPIVVGARDRTSLRRAVDVRCQVVTEADFRLIGQEGTDLSPHGMFVRTDREVALGEVLIVTFRAPGTHQWVDAQAVVARRVWGRRTYDRQRGIGIRFTEMDQFSRIVLTASLRGYPPPVPGRSLRKDYASSIYRIAESTELELAA